jgi:hypothetical protein
MKKNFLKYFSIAITVLIIFIIYFSTIGFETDKFNKQIKDRFYQKNKRISFDLKKIKLILDPLNFKINAKTIGTKIIYNDKLIELEYISTQTSLISIIKNQIPTSNIKISTKSILLKDLVSFARTINNRSELFILEQFVKSGYLIADLELNIDENGEIKKDYKIKGLLKDGKINFIKDYNFEKIDFLFEISESNYKFEDISFLTNKINFVSDKLNIKKNKKDYFFEGNIENKDTFINPNLIKTLKQNLNDLDFKNINFKSKNNFSFNINNELKLENLIINSEIDINETELKISNLINQNFIDLNDIIYLKNHKIKANYDKKNLTINGAGKIKLKNEFDEVSYKILSKDSDYSFILNILLDELTIKNKEFTKKFFPGINKNIILKKHNAQINYKDNKLSLKGSGKIRLDKELEKIDYFFSKNDENYNFITNLDIKETSFKIDFLNFEKNKKDKSSLKASGSYSITNGLNLDEINFFSQDNLIILNKLLLDKNNKIVSFDKIDLDYFDINDKKNKLIIKNIGKNKYKLRGSVFNANNLISNLLDSNDGDEVNIFKNNIDLILNLSKIYIDNKNIVKDLNGTIRLENNKVVKAELLASFSKNENIAFTINTKNNEKITTLFSSRAKPLVNRYKFIKGFEEGYLDFYSSKKNKVSKSTIKINDFKLQELPALTKLLSLASLQGIADLVSGEGIRFNEFEMNFTNKNNLMRIDEIYAIGPAISILMSGYIEHDKLISLRGTLVPATTLNKVIGSIPILGKILVGKKTGEGVFGVSFKIKGPPKGLKTSVNPIKTLTPRFITRTLEKIKKN